MIKNALFLGVLGASVLLSHTDVLAYYNPNVSALQAVGNALLHPVYQGRTLYGEYCRVEVIKNASLINVGGGVIWDNIYVSGYEPLIGIVEKNVGFFQLSSYSPAMHITGFEETARAIRVSVLIAPELPGVIGLGRSRGTLTLGKDSLGGLAYIEMTESSFDPSTNLSTFRTFHCGE